VKIQSLLLVLLMLLGWCGQANAQPQETRVALVIGNGGYKNSPLKNPVNDARDMALKLRGMGFTVIERNNLVVKQIGSTLREFRSKLTPGSVALVYYAGHGLQIKGDNYFPTVDAEISGEEDVPNQSLAMRQIMDVLGDAKTRLNLVFLDACRNNPYSRSFRSSSDGLSKVNAPTGTLISFATRPGSVAADGSGRNGLYTGALLEAMDNKGQPIEQVLKRVVTSVKAGSKNQQEPWMEGSIDGDFCFGNCNSLQVIASLSTPALNAQGNSYLSEERFWQEAKDIANVEAFEAYIEKYPEGLFIGLAKANLARLNEKNKVSGEIPEAAKFIGISFIKSNGKWVVNSIPESRAVVRTTLKLGDQIIGCWKSNAPPINILSEAEFIKCKSNQGDLVQETNYLFSVNRYGTIVVATVVQPK